MAVGGAILLCTLTALAGRSLRRLGPASPVACTAATLQLHLAAVRPAWEYGEWPQFTAAITNRGGEPVSLVQPGEGSDHGWRAPTIGWSILREGDPPRPHARNTRLAGWRSCGTIASLHEAELFVVEPGGTHPLADWDRQATLSFEPRPERGPALRPGDYRVVFYYANDPQRLYRGGARTAVTPRVQVNRAARLPGLGWFRRYLPDRRAEEQRALLARFQTTLPCALASSEVTIRVVEPRAALPHSRRGWLEHRPAYEDGRQAVLQALRQTVHHRFYRRPVVIAVRAVQDGLEVRFSRPVSEDMASPGRKRLKGLFAITFQPGSTSYQPLAGSEPCDLERLTDANSVGLTKAAIAACDRYLADHSGQWEFEVSVRRKGKRHHVLITRIPYSTANPEP